MRPYNDPAHRAGIADAVFNRLCGGLGLEAICATPGFPSRPTLRKWAREDPYVADRIAAGQSIRATRLRFPFEPVTAQDLLLRVRLGEPIGGLIRQAGMPHRRQLNAWKQHNPLFAAELADAKAMADDERRHYGRKHGGYRRSRLRYDEAIAGRIILALIRGATLPELGRDPAFPTQLGLKRWRRAHPDFDGALRTAMRAGHRARGQIRADRFCAPQLREKVLDALVRGASLHSLAKQPGMPGLYTLYKWVRERPDFAARVANACDHRTFLMADQAQDLLEARGLSAAPEIKAIWKRLGQMNPYPGERRREDEDA